MILRWSACVWWTGTFSNTERCLVGHGTCRSFGIGLLQRGRSAHRNVLRPLELAKVVIETPVCSSPSSPRPQVILDAFQNTSWTENWNLPWFKPISVELFASQWFSWSGNPVNQPPLVFHIDWKCIYFFTERFDSSELTVEYCVYVLHNLKHMIYCTKIMLFVSVWGVAVCLLCLRFALLD